jgi:iron complex transport system ATP-binding protein
MPAVLEFADVSVRRGQATLIDRISWRVDAPDRWVILGPNGAGKTTLLQVAAAMIHPTDGVAGILGEVLGTVDVFELRPRIGVTSAALADRIPRSEKVLDVVVSAGYGVIGRWRETYDELDYERADELLAELGAQQLAHRTFGTLSEGERKRVQIARALMTDPELLLLDEPFAALDEITRQHLDDQLRALWSRRRMTVLFVTHSIIEAAFLADRAIVLTRRPARIVLDHRLALPADRDAALRTDPHFAREMRKLFEALDLGERA